MPINDPPQIKSWKTLIETNTTFGGVNLITMPNNSTAIYVQISNMEPSTDSNAALAVQINGDSNSVFEVQPGFAQTFDRGEIAAKTIDFANVSASGGGGTAIAVEIVCSVIQG